MIFINLFSSLLGYRNRKLLNKVAKLVKITYVTYVYYIVDIVCTFIHISNGPVAQR